MIFGISHVVLPVHDLELARCFYSLTMGCEEELADQNFLELSNGFFRLRLELQVIPLSPVTLWIECDQIMESCLALCAIGAELLQAEEHQVGLAKALLRDPFGHTLILWRNLSEDELDTPPALPKTQAWLPEAEVLVHILLKEVPDAFRAGARKASVLEAEYLSQESNENQVSKYSAILGCIRSAPLFRRDMLKEPLDRQGVDWQLYQAEFEPDEDDI